MYASPYALLGSMGGMGGMGKGMGMGRGMDPLQLLNMSMGMGMGMGMPRYRPSYGLRNRGGSRYLDPYDLYDDMFEDEYMLDDDYEAEDPLLFYLRRRRRMGMMRGRMGW